ncbi:thioredoxin [Enterovibrio norvegicus FF-454]|uniref:Thioredoxin n=1 Tax=Enterovibrio norvegicus FF-454 TaxID=1185651 RepID=A0A1E5C553_9GAMM|nr:DsbA family protein [Enterovibrio norvegicus]OEE60626.1 thioredoxin [Enterovibrio norvegicus FF-454]
MAVTVNFHSDLLCFWGWVGQDYNDKIMHLWSPSQVNWEHHCLSLYANVPQRMSTIAPGDSGYLKYAEITERVTSRFEGLDVNPDLWRKVRPSSSLMPHQAIKAVKFAAGNDEAIELERALRKALFRDARDISHFGVLKDILEENHVATSDVMECLYSGRALADVYGDIKTGEAEKVPGSPAWVFDQGRYRFFGQVDVDSLAFAINGLVQREMR